MDKLQDARARIDAIDTEMARLFAARMDTVNDVVAYKKEHGMPVLDASREAQVIARGTARMENDVYKPLYADFLTRMMYLSRQYQKSILGENAVAYQGVEGAFSHIVLRRTFPHAEAHRYATFGEVFTAVENGEVTYGIVPFENSQAGDVAEILDLCYQHTCSICGMVDLPVQQNLLGVPGASLGDIKEVFSHPQALSQTARFLKSLGVTATPMLNTAVAAKTVAENGDKTKGAIASLETARLYGLSVLAEDISTATDNTTRFIILCRTPKESGSRCSMLFTVQHEPGSLVRVLNTISDEGFNMECIKSRPRPHTPFEYFFYVEVVGDITAESIQILANAMQTHCKKVRVLGMYDKTTAEGTNE